MELTNATSASLLALPGDWALRPGLESCGVVGETRYALPIFAMQNIAFGEAISLSRLGADMKPRSMHRDPYNNYVDTKTPTLIQFNDVPVAYLQAG